MTEVETRGKTFRQLVTEAKEEIQEIPIQELKEWMTQNKDIVILDVREPEDFKQGQIPGAVSIPRGLLELEIDELVPDQDKAVVLYCGGGSRSALAAQTLHVMGYQQVYSLEGGYRDWKAFQ